MLKKNRNLQQLLANDADREIRNALTQRRQSHLGFWVAKPHTEPMAVASLVLVGVHDIHQAWQKHLGPHGYKVSMTGVFCHNSPQVKFTDKAGQPQRCELADLLIVIDHQNAGRAVDRRASLVQAKIASGTGDIPGAHTADQLELLMYWHPFTLPSAYNQSPRDFKFPASPPTPIMSGSYGGIDLGQPNKLWTQVRPQLVMNISNGCSLGEFLAAMSMGDSGFGREAIVCPPPAPTQKPLKPEDWSATIAEMLKVTATSPFSLALSIRQRRPQRGVTMFGHIPDVFYSSMSSAGGDGLTIEPPYPGIGDGENGVNALYIKLVQDARIE